MLFSRRDIAQLSGRALSAFRKRSEAYEAAHGSVAQDLTGGVEYLNSKETLRDRRYVQRAIGWLKKDAASLTEFSADEKIEIQGLGYIGRNEVYLLLPLASVSLKSGYKGLERALRDYYADILEVFGNVSFAEEEGFLKMHLVLNDVGRRGILLAKLMESPPEFEDANIDFKFRLTYETSRVERKQQKGISLTPLQPPAGDDASPIIQKRLSDGRTGPLQRTILTYVANHGSIDLEEVRRIGKTGRTHALGVLEKLASAEVLKQGLDKKYYPFDRTDTEPAVLPFPRQSSPDTTGGRRNPTGLIHTSHKRYA